MPRIMLQSPRPQSVFFAHILCMSYVIKRLYWLVPRSVVNNYCVLFTAGQGQKGEQKHPAKSFVEFHNPSTLLTIENASLQDGYQFNRF